MPFLPAFLTFMTFPSKSNQKGAPIAIAKPLTSQPAIILKTLKTGNPLILYFVPLICCSTLAFVQPIGNSTSFNISFGSPFPLGEIALVRLNVQKKLPFFGAAFFNVLSFSYFFFCGTFLCLDISSSLD